MRNLKKILALVLALVMSLSLMATAGAASFQDVTDDNPYKTAIDVLDELKVFQGFDDGTFKPDGKLNRAQAAVLVYRIATGDVENKYLDNYTFMQQSKFTDLDGYNWAKGYINYCQNAGIVVGTTATTFEPGKEVTGYQLLVMLLRTLGYGKAGEFADPKGWELQTASIAEREGILKNVTTGDLGAAAPRQMVAEILFRGLLTETVTYSALTSGGYTKGETLGKRELGLEEIEGVVMANEFADLNTPQVLPEGKTQIQVEGEDSLRTLDYGTKITDIGESRLIYTQNTARVLYMADSGKNTTKEYGEGVDISTAAKFRSVSELTETTETEYYTNFEPTGYYTSDFRIEYTIWKDMTADEAADYTADNNGRYLAGPNNGHTHSNGATYFWYNYNKAIKAGDPITLEDMNNIYTIFTQSNGIWGDEVDQLLPDDEIGQVFVGTQTKKDISDEISYNQFLDTYINDIVTDKNWNASNNGEWVKFIDNDGDGNAEYAFRTRYALTEVVSSYTNKAGDTVMQYAWDNTQNTDTDVRRQNFDDDDHTYQSWDYTVRYMQDDEAIERDVAVGDIVLAASIDNQFLVSKAESVTTEATNYNYKDDEITAADGNTYGQSGIWNITTMQNLIASMAPKTTYEMFLDKFGFVRAYRLPGGTQYALVTELYYTNNAQGNLIQNWPMTVELTMPDEDGKPVTKEYNLANLNSALRSSSAWTQISNLAQSGNYYNWLQPAVAHLGVTWSGMTPVLDTPDLGNSANLSYWTKSLQLIRPITSLKGSTEFNYGPQNYIGRDTANYGNPVPVDPTVSFTNVAVVGIDGDNATVNGAAKVRLNQAGQASGVRTANDYAVDYIQLSTGNVVKGAASYNVGGDDAYRASYNRIVNADKDTEIYIVYDKGVKYFKGYANMPALNADTVGSIHAAYTVARNTNTGTSSNNYWIADVIVYEVEKWDDLSETSISLAYYTYNQSVQSTSSVTIDTLNNKTDPAKVQLIPSGMSWGSNNNWWDSWGYRNGYGWLTDNGTGNVITGYGFYRLYNETSATEGVMSAAAIEKITKDFNKAGIFAGTVTREVDLAKNGYIPVNMTGAFQDGRLKTEALISIADGKVYSVTYQGKTNETSDYYPYYEANNLWFNNSVYSNVKANDRIIWVGSGVKGTTVNSASFIVDLGSRTNGLNDLVDNSALWDQTASWLKDEISSGSARNGLWKQIMLDQNPTPDHSGDIKITIEHRTGVTTNNSSATDNGTVITNTTSTEIYVEKNGTWNISDTDSNLAVDGYVLQGLYTHADPYNNTAVSKIGSSYGINNVGTTDITLYANYTAAAYSLQVVGASSQTSTATFDYVQPNGDDATHSSFTLDATGSGSADSVQKDSKFTITVTVAAGKTISVAGNKAVEDLKVSAMDASNKVTITGKVTGAAVVTVTEAAHVLKVAAEAGTGATALTTVNVKINSGSSNATAIDASTTVAAGDTYEITFTPAAFTTYEYSVNGAAYVDVPANGKITGTIAAADWTTTVTIKASKMTNDEIDDAVTAPGGVPGGAANVGAGQIGYNDAYALLDVNVQSGNPKSTITVDKVKFMEKVMDSSASEAVKQAVNTIWSTADPSLCAAGVSLVMPAGTAKVDVTTSTGSTTSYTKDAAGSNLLTSSNGDGTIYLNLWLTLATGTHANQGDPITNLQLGNSAGATDRTITYTIDIYANAGDATPVATIERVVEVVYN